MLIFDVDLLSLSWSSDVNGPDISLMTARHQSIKLAADLQQLEHFWLCMCGVTLSIKYCTVERGSDIPEILQWYFVLLLANYPFTLKVADLILSRGFLLCFKPSHHVKRVYKSMLCEKSWVSP